jgi:hypothetical protein
MGAPNELIPPQWQSNNVMTGLVPAIHVLLKEDVGARHKAGHDVAKIGA